MSKQFTGTSRKALVVIPDWGLAWYIYCLEHAVQMSKSGIEVSILDLSNLNPRIFKKRLWRWILNLSQKNRLNDIKQKISKFYQINLIETTLQKQPRSSTTMSDERNLIFLSAIASKYSSITGRRDTQPEELNDKIVELERYFFSATADLIVMLQNQFNFDEVFTVNGRYVVDGAIVQACRESQIKCRLIESASSIAGKYAVYPVSPHDIPSVSKMHIEMWNKAGSERDEVAKKGLQRKSSGMAEPGFNFRANFTEKFSSGHGFTSRKIAAFFPSSDREFAIFPEFIFRESFGGSQPEAFLAFCKIAQDKKYLVIVRTHPPNSMDSMKTQDEFADVEDEIWRNLCKKSGAEFIESRSKISSYDLIEKADLCATYASSISIECILAKKPILILGESEISHSVPEICAFNEVELKAKFTESIPIISEKALYPYAYWLESGGVQLELFEFYLDREVYFNNKLVNEYRLWAGPVVALKKNCKKISNKFIKQLSKVRKNI